MTHRDKRRRSDTPEVARKAAVRVLAIDDDRSYLALIRALLLRAGVDVTIADAGTEALGQVERDHDINLLLIDLAMPVMDGIETLRAIQQRVPGRGFYSILLTAHSGSETKLRAYASGFDDFLAKGDSEEELVAKVRSAARRLEMERQLHLDNQRLERLAFTDELTAVGNRRALFRAFDELNAESREFSLVLFDLDGFKRVNDAYGHAMGDRVLVDVAGCLKAKTRVGDVLARWGGDEFVLLVADAGIVDTGRIATRIAQSIAALEWKVSHDTIRVRASFGATAGTSDLLDGLQKCDVQLYRNKRPAKAASYPGASDDRPRAER